MPVALPEQTFSPSEAKQFGLNTRTLYRYVQSGRIEQVGPGLYRRAGLPTVDLDLVEIARRRPAATLCLTSALAQHGLIDAIPARIDVALPRGQRGPRTAAPVRWHLFNARTFDIGRETMPTGDGEHVVGIYSAERSIVDAFRLRGAVGYEVGPEALRRWLAVPGHRPAVLLRLASELPQARGPLQSALSVLT